MELGHVGELSNGEHRKTMEKPNNLTARIATLAAKNNMSAGEFAMQSISRLVSGASDEEWLAFDRPIVARRESRSSFLRPALSKALPLL
jgi:hypothetical protein